MTRRIVVSAWLGLALAALFFYPLAAALQADIYYLQWQLRDVIETAAAIGTLALILACVIFVAWPRPTRLATAVLVVAAALPLASLAAGVSRQVPFNDALRLAWENRALRLVAPAAAIAGGLLIFVVWPKTFGRWFRRLLVLVSPVSLVVLGSLIISTARTDAVVAVERGSTRGSGVQRACAPVLALLFDELSFSYLYDERGDLQPEFPEIRRFGSTATHYLSVSAPGHETLNALPSFLAARRVRDVYVEGEGLIELAADGREVPFNAAEPAGLFATARGLGFRTEIAGYYLAYCELLADLVNACKSLSFYKVSSPDDFFSPVDSILTTLVLWPRQFPFGLLKNPSFARHQRQLVDELVAFARRPVTSEPPVFRLVHFSVPHLPFVFDAEGYDPPFDPLQTTPDVEYVEQTQYVDRLVGNLVAQLRREGTFDRATVVVLADHGYRFGGRERDPLHIPFIVKLPGQQARVDVTSPLQGETLLKRVLQDGCKAN